MSLRSLLLPLVVAGLVLSVPMKAWTIVAAHDGSGPGAETVLAQTLVAEGFRTSYEERILVRRSVLGEAGACRVWMGLVSNEGWHRDIVVSSAKPGEEVAFFFKGRAYADQPTWATWLDEKTAVLARSFAVPIQPSPVVAAHIGSNCSFDRAELAERLRRL